MGRKTAYMYVPDMLADWEPGYVVAELNPGRYFKKDSPGYSVKTFGISKEPVTTLGGIPLRRISQ